MGKAVLSIGLMLLCASFVQSQRIDYTINAGWKYHKGAVSEPVNSELVQTWETISLPHTWNDKDAFDDVPGYYRGIGWYAKELNISPEWKSKSIVLHFEGVNQEADIYLNGKHLVNHKGGYTAFNLDISDHANYGARNLLLVKVDNKHDPNIPPLNADFSFYGGIYRDVRLIVASAVHFDMMNHASDGVFIETREVSKERASITVTGKLVNNSSADKKIKLQTTILDKHSKVVASKVSEIVLHANSQSDFIEDKILVRHPNLWSPASPYLYRAVIRITPQKGEDFLDEITLPVGLRWYGFTGDKGFMLNGEPFKLIGANRHQDFMGKGNALTNDYHRNDYTKIKELGFNFVRLAHYPQAREVYRTCDELGLLVWSEIPVVNEITQAQEFTDNCITMQREHIRQTRNHPSVILYGYMNEVLIKMLSNKKLTEAERVKIADSTVLLAKKLNALTKKEAPERATVMALHFDTGYNKYGISSIPDVIGWNLYFGWYYGELGYLSGFLNEQHSKYPARPMIVSEYGADADARNHTLVPRSWDFSEDYQNILHSSYLRQMLALKYLSGFAAWNFADFGAENRMNATPFINQKGLVNYDRTEKDVCDLYRAYFTKAPVLRIISHNNTKRSGIETTSGSGSSIQPVSIFTNLKRVELFHNGKSLGVRTVKDNQLSYNVAFKNGINILQATDHLGHSDEVHIDFDLLPIQLKNKQHLDLAVNVGAFQYFLEEETNLLWVPDQPYKKGSWGYIGGSPNMKNDRQLKVGIAANILSTKNEPLFQTFNEGLSEYRFDAADGNYTVTLCFIEPYSKTPGEELIYNLTDSKGNDAKQTPRIFSVSINGINVIDSLNLAKESGALRAVTFDINVAAKNGSGIDVKFNALTGKTVLSGIRIKKLD